MARAMTMSVQLVGGLGCTGLALALIGWAVQHSWQSMMFRRHAVRLAGRIVAHVPEPGDGDGPPGFRLVVAFDYRDRRYVCHSGWSTSRPRAIGRPMAVLVPKGGPDFARVHAFAEWWGLSVLLGFVGLALLAAGLVLIAAAS
jgi:hypothetical protein